MITYRLRRHLQYLPLLGIAAGALFFLPGDETAQPSATVMAGQAKALPSYIVRLPDPVASEPIKVASIDPVAAEATPSPMVKPNVTVQTVSTAALAGEADPIEREEPEALAAQLAHATTAVNVRAGPSTSNAKLFVLQPGEPVNAASTADGWVEIVTASGESGWVYSRYLEQGTGAPDAMDVEQDFGTSGSMDVAAVNVPEPSRTNTGGRSARLGGDAALYAAPSRGAERLFVLEAGERVTVAETDGSWARVVLRSGATGWVRMR